MRFTKKELKRIIQEEYQKVLKEYISEDAAQFAQQQNKAGKGPSDNTAMVAKTVLDFEEALGTFTDVTPEVQSALDALSSALGLATSGGEESSPHPGGEPDIYAMMDEGEDEGKYSRYSRSSYKGEDPRAQAFDQAISLLSELTYDSLEDDVASWADEAVNLLSKAIDQLEFNRNKVGNT